MNLEYELPEGNIKDMNYEELKNYCAELRNFIINAVCKNGGHLASNLGVVELTCALHRVFNFPEDKLIFDVGHQSYVHKILSGRAKEFENLRNYGGTSGFQVRSESDYDFFGGGHSGTSVSAAIGFAEAEKLNGGDRYAIAVVGDGSFTNGMIYEAINNASNEKLRLVIIINDNEMSISKNVGGVSRYFGRLRTSVKYFKLKRKFKNKVSKVPVIGKPIAAVSKFIKDTVKRLVFQKNMFEHLGMDYIGPVDGHDLVKLEAVLNEAKYLEKPVVVHVCTQKGKGFAPAEENPAIYHGVAPFDRKTGILNEKNDCFSNRFGEKLVELAEKDEKIIAITAAMCGGTGLRDFKHKYRDRFFDVGIAEEHAVTFAAGLSAAGKTPVFAVYSSFLQRTYDQLIHDISIQNLHVVLAVDRAGFVANDGMTHQGIFDCSFLESIPNTTIYSPETYQDLNKALDKAVNGKGLVAVRYPRGKENNYDRSNFKEFENLRYAKYGEGKEVTLITYGVVAENVNNAAIALSSEYTVNVIVLTKIKPLDFEKITEICKNSKAIVICEEGIKCGGAGEKIAAYFATETEYNKKIKIIAIDECYPTHASKEVLYKLYDLDSESIVNEVKKLNIV